MAIRTEVILLRKGTKQITIVESTIGELEEKFGEAVTTKVDKLIEANSVTEAKAGLFSFVYDNIPKFVEGVTSEDIKASVMSELEGLIEAYIRVNFFGIKRMAGPLIKTLLGNGLHTGQ